MPLLNIFKKLFGILFSIFGLIGRILNKIICRAKRLRRDSGTLLPMTTDQISTDVPLSVPSNDMNEVSWLAFTLFKVKRNINASAFLAYSCTCKVHEVHPQSVSSRNSNLVLHFQNTTLRALMKETI